MDRSPQIELLAVALSKAQAMLKSAPKDSLNPHFKSRYADLASALDACREALAAHGFSVSQHPTSEGKVVRLETILLHASGQFLSSTLTMTAQQDTPQGIGSAVTYARRYALMAIVGIAADDDDGEQASKPVAAATQSRPPIRTEWGNAINAFAKLGKKEQDLKAYLKEVFGPNAKEITYDHLDALEVWYEELSHES